MAHRWMPIVLALALACPLLVGADDLPVKPTSLPDAHAAFRHPIALTVANDHLIVANQRGGTLSIVDLARSQIVSETKVAQQLSGLAQLPNGNLLASDELKGELLLLNRSGGSINVVSSLPVGYSPVSICPAPDGSWCAVSLLWAHQLALVDLRHSDNSKSQAAGMGPTL